MSFLILIVSTQAQTYYVSNTGSDSNIGSTASAPIKTIAKVNAIALKPGDQVLFNRGDRWDFLYGASINDKSGSSSGNITYGAYGSGAKPIFTRSMHANELSDWNNQGGNIWSTAFTINDDVGLIIFNDESGWGKKQASLADLKIQGDFYYNPTTDKTYLYSTSNPASHYNNIELSKKGNIFDINNGQYIVIKDLDLRYSAKDAVFVLDSHHIYMMNLSTHFIGGAYQSGTLRYGNALEVLGDSSQIYFSYNTIFQTYDAGVSPQIGYFTDIYIKHNTIIKARYCYEYFNHNPDEITNRIVFDHNTCYDSGGGFGGTSSGKGVRTGAMDGYINQFNITNNIFYGGTTYLVEMQAKFDSTNSNLNNNLYYSTNNAGFHWRGTTYTYTNFAAYQTASKEDKNSIKADPLFTDPAKGDFRPKQGSPACTMSSSGSYVGAIPCSSSSSTTTTTTTNNPPPTTTTTTSTTGLKGSWDLTTNYLDKINGNKAINYGSTYFMTDSIYQSVLKLSDSKSYLKIAYADGSLAPKDGFTVDVKVKFNSARQSYIVSDTKSYMLQRVLIDKTTTRFQAGVYSGNTWNPILNSNTNLQTNKWYRVTYTYDKASGIFKLYLDKKLNAQKTWLGKVDVSSASEVFVGNREELDRWLDGSICNLRIYNKALSATEILNLQ